MTFTHSLGTGSPPGSKQPPETPASSVTTPPSTHPTPSGSAPETGSGLKTDTLIITGGVVALLLSVGVSALFFCLPLINSEAETTWAEAGVLGAPGLVGALSAGATFYSARHEGRWGWVGLALGLAFLVLTVATVLRHRNPPHTTGPWRCLSSRSLL